MSLRLKHRISMNTGGVWGGDPDGDRDTIVLRSTDQTVDGGWRISDPAVRAIDPQEASKCRLIAGDILITKSSGSDQHIGKASLVTPDVARLNGVFSNFNQRVRLGTHQHPRFFWYYMNSSVARYHYVISANSTSGLGNLNASVIGELPIPEVNLPMQERIADFLRCETAHIDRLIEKKRELVELLREKREALCSHAVTRGLDSGALLRPTDSSFVPLIPAHWTLPRLKQLATLRGGITVGRRLPTGAYTVDVPYLRVANVQAGWVDLSDVTALEVLPSELDRYRLKKGDVLMNEGGDNDKLGRGVVWDAQIVPCLHQNHVFAARPKEPGLGEWIALSSNAKHGRDFFFLNSRQSTNLASIAKSRVEQFPVPLPPYQERQVIIEFVQHQVRHSKHTESRVQQSIDRLREFRSALITAAVTGQIDVENWGKRGNSDRRMEAIEAEVRA